MKFKVAYAAAFTFLRRQSFGLAILVCAALAFAFPCAFTEWFGVKLMSLVVPAIQLIMFGMGTTLSPGDFLRVARRPWAVATGVFLQFLVMPLVGFALAKALGFSGELAAGCVLVGAVAGGTASNVIAFLAKADVALSVTMTCCSTLLSPFVTPLAMKILAGCFVEIDAMKMMLEILKVVIFPMVAGGIAHRLLRRQFDAHKAACDKVLSVFSMAGICFTILALTAPSRDTFAAAGALIIVAAVVHNTIGYLGGYWFTRFVGRFAHLSEAEARTVAIEVGMQNGGMAGALAVGVLGSAVAALPANVFSIWMNFSGSVLANFWSRRPVSVGKCGATGRIPLAAVAVVLLLAMPAAQGAEPLVITTREGLAAITNNLAGRYVLVADIDFEGATIEPIGGYSAAYAGITPIGLAEKYNAASYPSFDFTNTWSIAEGVDEPRLVSPTGFTIFLDDCYLPLNTKPDAAVNGIPAGARYVFGIGPADFAESLIGIGFDTNGKPYVKLPAFVNTEGVTVTVLATEDFSDWIHAAEYPIDPATGICLPALDPVPDRMFFRYRILISE